MIAGLTLALCGLLGAVLGFFFFGALWLTIRRLPETPRPGLTLAGSYLLRLVLATAGFLWLAWQGIGCLLAGLVGFLGARHVWISRVRTTRDAVSRGVAGVQDEERRWS